MWTALEQFLILMELKIDASIKEMANISLLHFTTDDQLMKWLFKESDQNITGKTARFISPNSHQVSLSVYSPNSNQYEIKLQTQNMALLLQMENSIKNRLKVCFSTFLCYPFIIFYDIYSFITCCFLVYNNI